MPVGPRSAICQPPFPPGTSATVQAHSPSSRGQLWGQPSIIHFTIFLLFKYLQTLFGGFRAILLFIPNNLAAQPLARRERLTARIVVFVGRYRPPLVTLWSHSGAG